MTLKDTFPGYFRPKQDEFDELWANAIIVPDTNILLHILRYGKETRDEVMGALRAFKSRLWVPYWVALEFSRKWRTVDEINRKAYEKLKSAIRKDGRSLANQFNDFSRHQVIDSKAESAKVVEFIDTLCSSLDEAAARHPSMEEAESVLAEIIDLIGDSIGATPTEDELSQWRKVGKERFDQRIPPGYMDARDKEGDERFGDYFIWEQIIDQSKSTGKHVIFVSDDRKEDWIQRVDGKDIGPRPELVQEFKSRVGMRFYCYPFRGFITRASEFTKTQVSPAAIAEIKEKEQQANREEAARREAAELAAAARRNRMLQQALTHYRLHRLGLPTKVPRAENELETPTMSEGLAEASAASTALRNSLAAIELEEALQTFKRKSWAVKEALGTDSLQKVLDAWTEEREKFRSLVQLVDNTDGEDEPEKEESS